MSLISSMTHSFNSVVKNLQEFVYGVSLESLGLPSLAPRNLSHSYIVLFDVESQMLVMALSRPSGVKLEFWSHLWLFPDQVTDAGLVSRWCFTGESQVLVLPLGNLSGVWLHLECLPDLCSVCFLMALLCTLLGAYIYVPTTNSSFMFCHLPENGGFHIFSMQFSNSFPARFQHIVLWQLFWDSWQCNS